VYGNEVAVAPWRTFENSDSAIEENLEPPFGFAQGRLRTHGAQRSAEYFIRVFFAEKKLLQVLIKTNLIRRGL
jgi:hypothetical protein